MSNSSNDSSITPDQEAFIRARVNGNGFHKGSFRALFGPFFKEFGSKPRLSEVKRLFTGQNGDGSNQGKKPKKRRQDPKRRSVRTTFQH